MDVPRIDDDQLLFREKWVGGKKTCYGTKQDVMDQFKAPQYFDLGPRRWIAWSNLPAFSPANINQCQKWPNYAAKMQDRRMNGKTTSSFFEHGF